MRAPAAIAIASLALLGAFAAPAGAATITPDITADELDNSGGAGDTGCSLREAVAIANVDSSAPEPGCAIDTSGGPLGNDTIALGSNDYALGESGSTEDANANGDLDVDPGAGDLVIDGVSPASTTITQTLAERVLHQVGVGDDTLTVSDLTITGGAPVDTFGGGGISSTDGDLLLQGARVNANTTDGVGGGVAALGDSLQVANSTISGNTSTHSGGGGVFLNTTGSRSIASSLIEDNHVSQNGGGPSGGGILAVGALSLTSSAIVDNDVTDSGVSSVPVGGGIAGLNGSLAIRDTTVSGNEVLGGAGRQGGGIRTAGTSGSLTVVNSTVSGNQALGTASIGAGILAGGPSTTIVHTTIGPNQVGTNGAAIAVTNPTTVRASVLTTSGGKSVCAGLPSSGGGNVSEDLSCTLSGTGDVEGLAPGLGGLADNGGPDAGATGFEQAILTHLPLTAPLSPAVDHVPAGSCTDLPSGSLLTDQRGLARPDDADLDGTAACEAGSVELQVAPDGDFDGVPDALDQCDDEPGPASNQGCAVPPPPPPPTGTGGGQPSTQQPVTPSVKKKKCKRKKSKRAAKKKCKKRKR
jgi:CSLREA domain-containing protein